MISRGGVPAFHARWNIGGLVLGIALGFAQGSRADPPPAPASNVASKRATPASGLPSTNLHNLFKVSPQVFSGGSPGGEPAFAELARLGVKTIISVDGSAPNADLARRHGLRYVHLPFGYDGVGSNRVVELTAAARSFPGPFYVHCHHGLHRGPAAVAVVCQTTDLWTPAQGLAWLQQAGTSRDYPGLYRSVAQLHPPDPRDVADIRSLPEIARTSSLTEAMVALDADLDHLKAFQKAGWDRIPEQPDLTPPHTATLLWEHLRELARIDDTAGRPSSYRRLLAASEGAALLLRQRLEDPAIAGLERDGALKALSQSCTACHREYRNASPARP